MKILSIKQSKKLLASGKVRNADCATPGALDLPDGNCNAERVAEARIRKTGKIVYDIVAPWLLADVFHLKRHETKS